MRKFIYIVIFACVGCNIPAKTALEGPGGRHAYNIEVQKTNAEEMLLNLVRLRYFDSPFFLQVSSVTSQYTWKNAASISAPIPGFNEANPGSLQGATEWQTQPTVQYTPLDGKEFSDQLMQPVDIKIIQQLIYSGWDIDRVFLLAIQSFNEYHNLTKEGSVRKELYKYEKFNEILKCLQNLQFDEKLQIGIKQTKYQDNTIQSLQIAFPKNDENSEKIANILNITELSDSKYLISAIEGFDEKGDIGILTRSLLSCMYYLSQSVLVPKEDIQAGKAAKISQSEYAEEEVERIFKDLLTIYCCKSKPDNCYVCVKYRNNWFYVKDTDIHSKKTFALLLELFNLQSGRKQEQNFGPVLTLPIGVS